MAPAFDRLAQTPWPIACCASSGTRPFSSALARSMLEMRIPGADENVRELRPGIGGAHINNSDRLNARLRRLDPEQGRGLAVLHTAPELPLRGDNEVLIERIGMGGDLDPFAAAGDDRQHR